MKALTLLDRKQFILQEIRLLREIAKGAILRREASRLRNEWMAAARMTGRGETEQGIPGLIAAE